MLEPQVGTKVTQPTTKVAVVGLKEGCILELSLHSANLCFEVFHHMSSTIKKIYTSRRDSIHL